MEELSSMKAREISNAAAEKKAIGVTILDLRELSTIADYFVIASGTSRPHLSAIAEAIRDTLKKQGFLPYHQEGDDGSGWVLLDYGDVIAHVLGESERQYYDLERLWRGAKVISISQSE